MSKVKQQEKKVFEERIKYLQLYLDHMMKENESLKQKLEDMKQTAMQNKNLLKEYILTISNKDQIVEKLQCTIENLQERINTQEEYIKKHLSFKNLKSSNIFNDKNQHHTRGLSESVSKILEPIDKNENEERRFLTSRKTTNTDEGINGIKEFFNKQKIMLDELCNLRREIQHLSDNTEMINKKKINKEKEDDNQSSKENSFISKASTDSYKNLKVNLVDKFSYNLKDMLDKYEDYQNNCIWEIVKRYDLSIKNLDNPDSICSISNIKHADEKNDLFLNIDFKNSFKDNLNNSEIEIMYNTEFKICELMEDSLQYNEDF